MMTDGPLSGGGMEWQSSRSAQPNSSSRRRKQRRSMARWYGPVGLSPAVPPARAAGSAGATATRGSPCGRERCRARRARAALSAAIGPDRTTVGIDLVFARDCSRSRRAGRLRDDGADSLVDRALDELVDQRVLERVKRLRPALAHGDQPVRIVAARVRDRNQHRARRRGRINGRWGKGHRRQAFLLMARP